jgi:1,4-dihydroxy-6-naphthoate synthase
LSHTLQLGISPCPNDTFAFHGLLTGAVRAEGIDHATALDDVVALNRALLAGRLDAAKVSFAAALEAGPRWVVLASGSALGFGVGPLLLAAPGRSDPARATAAGAAGGRPPRVLCPGEHTTATLLYRLLRPGQGELEQVVFSEILPRLAAGSADFGVCIHEGRFTYERYGLACVEDLGATWEAASGGPLPLGGIAARTELGRTTHEALAAAIRASIEHARADPAGALATMREHAREHDDDVLLRHVELYVNAWTLDLGDVGRRALSALAARAHAAGLVPERGALEVVP